MKGYGTFGDRKNTFVQQAEANSIAAFGVTFGIGSYITLVSFMTGLNQCSTD